MGHDLVVDAEIVVDTEFSLTLGDLCRICEIDVGGVTAMIQEGMIEPAGATSDEWRFDTIALRRIQMAVRLQRDLRVNLPGVALVLDLLDELEALRRKIHD